MTGREGSAPYRPRCGCLVRPAARGAADLEMPEPIATFRGPVSCTRSAGLPGFALAGLTAERPGEPATLVFPAPAPADLPARLEDARIEQLAAGEYRISTAAAAWRIASAAPEMQREVAAAFYRAIPPRRAPWLRRTLWSAVLTLAASRAGLAVLRRLRR